MVPRQRVIELLGKVLVRLAPRVSFQDMLRQLHFAVQHLQVLFLEVALDGIANKQAEQKQYAGRRQCEQQSQPKCQ